MWTKQPHAESATRRVVLNAEIPPAAAEVTA
jgi:hypothetical protein